ncbi:MAG TPA: hypothetical protein VE569_12260 [Acidimicrobiia bacterium]|nr:hypothetical protein [Acidimicrobiia bacterium]
MRRSMFVTAVTAALCLLIAAPALADHCTNASKSDPMDGAQVLIGADGSILWTTEGLAQRLEAGLIGEDGEGFHGIIALDLDGDGVADVSTWFGVGPEGDAIADPAILNGPACRGITDLFTYLSPICSPA